MGRGRGDAQRHALRTEVKESGPVRVTFISSHAREGGSETYLLSLLRGLGGAWIREVILLEEGPLVERLRDQGIEPVVIPTGTSKRAALATAVRLRRAVTDSEPDVVHANGVKAATVAALALLPVPLLWLKHDFSFDGRLARFIARRADRVVGVSHAVLENLSGTNLQVIYTGLATRSVDREEARRRLIEEIGASRSLVGLVGRYHPAKGQRELIASIPTIVEKDPGTRFVLIGGEDPSVPHYAEAVREEIDRSEPGRIVELGHREDVPELMAALDVLVVPTVHDERGMGREGFGLAALEAMSAGTPVVAYDSGGLAEVLGDCGLLVPLRDRRLLADSVAELVADPARRKILSRCGLERARDRFSRERWLQEMRAAYGAIARSRS